MTSALINRQARQYYGHREDFQRIVRRVGSPDNRDKPLEKLEADLALDQQIVLIKRQTPLLKRVSVGVMRFRKGLSIINSFSPSSVCRPFHANKANATGASWFPFLILAQSNPASSSSPSLDAKQCESFEGLLCDGSPGPMRD